MNVAITAADQNTDVSFYEAGYQRHVCSVPAGVSPLNCSLEGLSAGTQHRVYAMACMAGFECSHRTFGDGYTLPDGKEQHTCQYFQFFAYFTETFHL